MPRGAAVVRYEGSRGPVWRIKYRDAAGKQVQETLGPAPPWAERKAQRELGKRLAAVNEGFRKPERTTFAEKGYRSSSSERREMPLLKPRTDFNP